MGEVPLPLLCQLHFRDCGYLDMRVGATVPDPTRRFEIALLPPTNPLRRTLPPTTCPGFAQSRPAAQNGGRVAQNPLGLAIDQRAGRVVSPAGAGVTELSRVVTVLITRSLKIAAAHGPLLQTSNGSSTRSIATCFSPGCRVV